MRVRYLANFEQAGANPSSIYPIRPLPPLPAIVRPVLDYSLHAELTSVEFAEVVVVLICCPVAALEAKAAGARKHIPSVS